jgi:hypothetical protein
MRITNLTKPKVTQRNLSFARDTRLRAFNEKKMLERILMKFSMNVMP